MSGRKAIPKAVKKYFDQRLGLGVQLKAAVIHIWSTTTLIHQLM